MVRPTRARLLKRARMTLCAEAARAEEMSVRSEASGLGAGVSREAKESRQIMPKTHS